MFNVVVKTYLGEQAVMSAHRNLGECAKDVRTLKQHFQDAYKSYVHPERMQPEILIQEDRHGTTESPLCFNVFTHNPIPVRSNW